MFNFGAVGAAAKWGEEYSRKKAQETQKRQREASAISCRQNAADFADEMQEDFGTLIGANQKPIKISEDEW